MLNLLLGVELHWIEPPPDEIKQEESFWTMYELDLSDAFYSWAFSTIHAFDAAGPNGAGFP